MIDDARERLMIKNNQNINKKVIMAGFSSSSLFAARFTFIHPDRVIIGTNRWFTSNPNFKY